MSQKFYSYPAPAKLNLMLHVTGMRSDGYHLIETVFRFIDLADTIEISVREDGLINLLNATYGVPVEQDLTVRAAKLLQAATNTKFGVDIRISKCIPMGGGLGGGSSDAATVLLALNHLWQLNLDRKQLMELGVNLGADVPVFIFGQNSFASGIGEKLTCLPMPDKWYVLVHPAVHVSTAQVFSSAILTRNSPTSIMRTLESAGLRRNDLESVVRKEYELVDRALVELGKFGHALMTGSGSCIFLECGSEQQAQCICREITKKWSCLVVRGLPHHPLLFLE